MNGLGCKAAAEAKEAHGTLHQEHKGTVQDLMEAGIMDCSQPSPVTPSLTS